MCRKSGVSVKVGVGVFAGAGVKVGVRSLCPAQAARPALSEANVPTNANGIKK
ncbi:MAG: hypothetical protein ABIL11_13005 [Chloroflexota bacterium]